MYKIYIEMHMFHRSNLGFDQKSSLKVVVYKNSSILRMRLGRHLVVLFDNLTLNSRVAIPSVTELTMEARFTRGVNQKCDCKNVMK